MTVTTRTLLRCGRLIPENRRRCKRLPGHKPPCEGYRHRADELDGPRPEPGVPLTGPVVPATREAAIAELVAAANDVRQSWAHTAGCTHRYAAGCTCGLWRLTSALDVLAGFPEVSR